MNKLLVQAISRYEQQTIDFEWDRVRSSICAQWVQRGYAFACAHAVGSGNRDCARVSAGSKQRGRCRRNRHGNGCTGPNLHANPDANNRHAHAHADRHSHRNAHANIKPNANFTAAAAGRTNQPHSQPQHNLDHPNKPELGQQPLRG